MQTNSTGISTSSSLEGMALVTPQDILGLNKKYCFIIVQGFAPHPVKATIPYYFNHKPFYKLIKNANKKTT